MINTKKKVLFGILILLVMIVMGFFYACTIDENIESRLSVDKDNNYYFAGNIALQPIKGERLDTETDAGNYEQVRITAQAENCEKFRISFTDVSEVIPGLKIVVDNGEPVDFVDEVIIFENENNEEEITLLVQVYLSSDVDFLSAANKQISFNIELQSWK